MATQTFSIFSVLCCLKEALRFGHAEDEIWHSCNEKQEEFLSKYYQYALEYLDIFSDQELDCIASLDVNKVNAWLRGKGFNIQLDPFPPAAGTVGSRFTVAAILDLLCEWNKWNKAKKMPLLVAPDAGIGEIESFQGVRINDVYMSNGIVRVPTKDHNMSAYFMMAEDTGREQIALQDHCSSLYQSYETDEIVDVHFPAIEVDQQPDISWLVGMSYGLVPMAISEALNQNKLSIDEKGAHAQSAVAISIVTGSLVAVGSYKSFIAINKPFYFWIAKGNCPVPVFSAYIDKDCWKRG